MMSNIEKITKLYEEEYLKYIKMMRYRVGGEINAEDVVQEAFANALQYIDSYDGSVPIENWFWTILTNAAKDFRRQELRCGMTDATEDEETESMDTIAYKNEIFEKALEEINNVESRELRKVLIAYFVNGWKTREIAKWAIYSHAHIRVLIYRFRQALREKYGEDMCS